MSEENGGFQPVPKTVYPEPLAPLPPPLSKEGADDSDNVGSYAPGMRPSGALEREPVGDDAERNRRISKIKRLVSALNYVTGNDFSKEHVARQAVEVAADYVDNISRELHELLESGLMK